MGYTESNGQKIMSQSYNQGIAFNKEKIMARNKEALQSGYARVFKRIKTINRRHHERQPYTSFSKHHNLTTILQELQHYNPSKDNITFQSEHHNNPDS